MGKMIIVKFHKYCLVICFFYFNYFKAKTQTLFFNTKQKNRIEINEVYKYCFATNSSCNENIEYKCSKLPNWIHFDKSKNILTGSTKNAGQYFIQIEAVSKDTATRLQFMLTVFNNKTKNILPIGNSITNGTSFYSSYRRELWHLLHNANFNFDFIGSWDKHHMGGVVPNPDFDMDHDGHSGWKASDMLIPPDWDKKKGNLNEWLLNYSPDIVLLELGTNEVFQCIAKSETIKNIDNLILLFRKKNPYVKILLATIPPLGSSWADKMLCKIDYTYAQAIKELNDALIEYSIQNNKPTSVISIVDQFNEINPEVDMYDDIHPNTVGEKKMAQKWFSALEKYLTKLNH